MFTFVFIFYSHVYVNYILQGIMSRVNEALLVLGLTGMVIMGIIFITSAIIHGGPYIQYAFSKLLITIH